MLSAGRDRAHAAEPDDLTGHAAQGGAAVAELAGPVIAPCPNGSVSAQRQVVVLPACNGNRASQARHLDRRHSVERGVITDLAISVVAPGPHGPVTLECQAVAPIRAD